MIAVYADTDESMTCPVCWDVYYNPYICRPCSHVFCEPCLRKLARYSHAAKRDTTCPICRETVQFCVIDYGPYLCVCVAYLKCLLLKHEMYDLHVFRIVIP